MGNNSSKSPLQSSRSITTRMMANKPAKTNLCVLLIGKPGSGRSATGNSILGRKQFRAPAYDNYGTKAVRDALAEHGPYEIQVVNGLDLQDWLNTGNIEQALENMTMALMKCEKGVHAFVLVIRYDSRFMRYDREGLYFLKWCFGDDFLKDRGIIVFIGGDNLLYEMEYLETPEKTLKQWCQEQDKDLYNLIQECGSRAVLFNNITKSEEEKIRQRNELLFHVEAIHSKRGLCTGGFLQADPQESGTNTTKTTLRVLLIGKTGHGKSATGNLILGFKRFETSSNLKSSTEAVEHCWAEDDQQEIQVVDGPGLENTDLNAAENKEQACENMAKALMKCNGGVHAFVLVIKFSTRFTREERQTLSDLKQIFGDDYLKNHGIIVFTGGDRFPDQMRADGTPGKTFKQWCQEQDKDFQNLIQECGSRVVLVNNVLENEEEKIRQRNELLSHAETIQNKGGLYTTEHFQKFAQARAKLIKDSKLKILEETIQKRIDLLSAELGQLSVDSSMKDVDRLDARIGDVYTEIGSESQQEESMQQLLACLETLSRTTKELRRAIEEKNMIKKQSLLESLSQVWQKLKQIRELPWCTIFKVIVVGLAVVGVVVAGAVLTAGTGSAALVPLGRVLVPMGQVLLSLVAAYLKNKMEQ